MIRFLLFLLLCSTLFASHVDRHRWQHGVTYLLFLEQLGLPTKDLYYNLDTDSQQLTDEMRSGINYQILKSTKGEVEQILLPLNDELQIHIFKNGDSYEFEAIPIISETKTEVFYAKVTSSANYTIMKHTGNKKIAQIFTSSFKNSLNFKNDIRNGDPIVMIYEQKYRLNHPFSMPTLSAAMIEMKSKGHYIYLGDDERYYDEKGHEVEGFLLARPVRGARISSYFTKRRYHPILKKWKAHLGVDYAAPSGTPIMAAGSGTIIHAARLGSYGNLIKIRHNDGYETRYAHLKSFRRGIGKWKKVKKGQVIGYVGTTGRSTGPHLHFELRKHGNAINPLKVVQVTTKKLKGKEYEAFLRIKKNYDESIALHLKNETQFVRLTPFQDRCYIYFEIDQNPQEKT